MRPRLPRASAIATLLFAIEMVVVLLFVWAIANTFSAIVAGRRTVNLVLTAGLEQAALTSANAGGAYTNVGWNGQGITIDAGALPAALSQSLPAAIPGSSATVTSAGVVWTLPASTMAAWHVSGPIVITDLQATSGPDQSVTLNGQTTTYPLPVLAGIVQVPFQVVSGFGVTWSQTLQEPVVLPLAGRTGPNTIAPYQ